MTGNERPLAGAPKRPATTTPSVAGGTSNEVPVSPDPTRYEPLTEARFHAASRRLIFGFDDDGQLAVGPAVGDQLAVAAWLSDLLDANPALVEHLSTVVNEAGGMLPVKLAEDAILTTVRHAGGGQR